MMSISGDRIKKCRISCDLTQEDVAKHLGIGKQAIYKYETGTVTNIPLPSVALMAELFDVSPAYLAGWTDQPMRTTSEQLTPDEHTLISGYRSLTPGGKEYLMQQVAIARAAYGEKDAVIPNEDNGMTTNGG